MKSVEMKNQVVQIALLQISIMMFMSAVFIAFWVYFYIVYEAISPIQLYGYYVLWAVCGSNFFIFGPTGIFILSAEIEQKCITRTTLSCYIILCFASLAPTPLLSNAFGKSEETRVFIREFFFENGRVPYLMDYIQRAKHCCGYNNYTDYYKSPEAEEDDEALNEPVPLSCCSEIMLGCEKSIGLTYKEGCFVTPGTNNALIAWEHPFHGTGFLAVVLIPMVLPLFQFLQTCFLHDAFIQLDRICRNRRHDCQKACKEEEEGAGDAGPSLVRETESSLIGGYSSSSSSSKSSSASGSASSSDSQRSQERVHHQPVNFHRPPDNFHRPPDNFHRQPANLQRPRKRDEDEMATLFTKDRYSKDGSSKYSEKSDVTDDESSEPSELFVTEEEALKLASGFFDYELLPNVHEDKKRNDHDDRRKDQVSDKYRDNKSAKSKATEKRNGSIKSKSPDIVPAVVRKSQEVPKNKASNDSKKKSLDSAVQKNEQSPKNETLDNSKTSNKSKNSEVPKEATRIEIIEDRMSHGGGSDKTNVYEGSKSDRGSIKTNAHETKRKSDGGSIKTKVYEENKSDGGSIKKATHEDKKLDEKSVRKDGMSLRDSVKANVQQESKNADGGSIKTKVNTIIAQENPPVENSMRSEDKKSNDTRRSKAESNRTEKSKPGHSQAPAKSIKVQEEINYNYQPEDEVTYDYAAAPTHHTNHHDWNGHHHEQGDLHHHDRGFPEHHYHPDMPHDHHQHPHYGDDPRNRRYQPPPQSGNHHGWHPHDHHEHAPHHYPPTFHSGGSHGHHSHGTDHHSHGTGHHSHDRHHEPPHHHHPPEHPHGHHPDTGHHHDNRHHAPPPHHNHHEPPHPHHDNHHHEHGHHPHGGDHYHARPHHH